MLTQELKDLRVIGSSDAPAIMGVSPWKTAYQLWEQKVFGGEERTNFAMSRGNRLEPIARESFEKKMNVVLFGDHAVKHKKYPWMTATLDGLDLDGKVLVEIKCGDKESHELARQGKVPSCYIPQLQHQLEVTGLDGMYYYSFNGTDGVVVEVSRDNEYIEELLEKEEDFYKCIVNFEPPALTTRDYHLQSEEWIEQARRAHEAQQKAKEFEAAYDIERKRLIEMSSNKNSQGGQFRLSRVKRSGRIPYAKIPAIKEMNLESYRSSPTIEWRLSLSKD